MTVIPITPYLYLRDLENVYASLNHVFEQTGTVERIDVSQAIRCLNEAAAHAEKPKQRTALGQYAMQLLLHEKGAPSARQVHDIILQFREDDRI